MIKRPSSWVVILYDVPSEPSKLKVRVWREFKKLGAIYPQMSLCILPNNDENVEECQEFIDENNLNIKNNKFTQEEVDEMEEVLDGLYRWFGKALSLDWIDESPKILQLRELLKKCQESMDNFAELSF